MTNRILLFTFLTRVSNWGQHKHFFFLALLSSSMGDTNHTRLVAFQNIFSLLHFLQTFMTAALLCSQCLWRLSSESVHFDAFWDDFRGMYKTWPGLAFQSCLPASFYYLYFKLCKTVLSQIWEMWLSAHFVMPSHMSNCHLVNLTITPTLKRHIGKN